MVDGKPMDVALAARVTAIVLDAYLYSLPPKTVEAVSNLRAHTWVELALKALSGRDLPGVGHMLELGAPAAFERLVLLLQVNGWCESCARNSRDLDNRHPCDIVVESTGHVCACIGCGPL